jgi:hypothetical protein
VDDKATHIHLIGSLGSYEGHGSLLLFFSWLNEEMPLISGLGRSITHAAPLIAVPSGAQPLHSSATWNGVCNPNITPQDWYQRWGGWGTNIDSKLYNRSLSIALSCDEYGDAD